MSEHAPYVGVGITTITGGYATVETWTIAAGDAQTLRRLLGEPGSQQVFPVEAAQAAIDHPGHVVL